MSSSSNLRLCPVLNNGLSHQKNKREQRLASCSGLGFTSVCTGSISPAVRAAGRRLQEARVRMLELRRRAGPLGGSLGGRQRLPGTERQPAQTPPPEVPPGARYALSPPPPRARERLVA